MKLYTFFNENGNIYDIFVHFFILPHLDEKKWEQREQREQPENMYILEGFFCSRFCVPVFGVKKSGNKTGTDKKRGAFAPFLVWIDSMFYLSCTSSVAIAFMISP